MVYCTHRLAENSKMKCPIRVGKGMIEVNPMLCASMSDPELEERLRIDVIRILLKHPYERQPERCCNTARAIGSNCVISGNYNLVYAHIEHPKDFNMSSNGHYEFYARNIQRLLAQEEHSGTPGDEEDGSVSHSEVNYDLAENWEQDELMSAQINETIRNIQSWGSMPGGLVSQIMANTKASINYRNVLAGFRASVIAQSRRLTRMRPNRRSGFEAMGSRYDFTTNMIVGVDVSGSISDKDLQNFYTTINHFFRYGILHIDVVQFDTELGEVTTINKASYHLVRPGLLNHHIQ